ncbi:MAG: hypothetical protein MI784_04515, partial [Cytophagales bacterium]|nr:hypothetical protein [Cytophagales bacterium]
GREVIDLTQNEFAGKQTVITWQGEESSGSMVRPGIYLVLVKAYHPDGDERQLLRKVYVVE